ncbi:MAG: response regulator [Saprospiraceae bacterium]
METAAKEAALKEKANAEIEQAQQQQQLLLASEQAERMNELDAMKSKFFANVTHEFRTPLTLILSPLDNLLKSDNLSNKEFTQLKIIQQNGQELLKLTNEMLDLVKLESSKITLNEMPIALYPFLQRLVGVFETYAQRKGINLSLEYAADPHLQVNLDKNKTEKIINNLLSNALKFTQEGGAVKVKLTDQGHSLQMEVTDTGRGIHPDDLPHIFNRFYQSKQPNTIEGGTGIGLAMAIEFAKLSGGGILVESTLGEGSTFTFSFPKKQVLRSLPAEDWLAIEQQSLVSPIPLPLAVTLPTEVVNTVASDKPSILIVEDNTQLRAYIQSLLGESHQVHTAENGKVALDWLNDDTHPLPDLIVSDVMMPIIDGFQLLQSLKESDRFCAIPVIMLTARVEMEDKLNALRIGVDAYMLKPFVEEELLARVANILKNAKARKQPFVEEDIDTALENEIPSGHVISPDDLLWLSELEEQVLVHLSHFDFNLEQLSELIFLSPRQIRRRLKQITGLSFNHYLNEARFSKARQLLENAEVRSVKQLAYEVGMRDVKYFSQQFRAHFGKLPSDYL